jgi:hypothetical protein
VSAVDVLVGAGTTLLGFGISYLIEERKSRREVRLRSFDNRQAALNEVFGALTECFFDIRNAIHTPPRTSEEYNRKVVSSIQKFERTIYLRALWLSTIWPKVANASRTFGRTAVAIKVRLPDLPPQSVPPASTVPFDLEAFEAAYFEAGNAIGMALGIPSLEQELQDIIGSPNIQDPSQN